MAKLVVAPQFEPAKNGMKLPFRMTLHLAEDSDVAGVADLLGQIRRIENELRPEVGVLLHPRQEAEIDADTVILEDFIDEAGMPRLVATHVAEELVDILVLDAFLDFRIEHAARKLGGERTDEEILE